MSNRTTAQVLANVRATMDVVKQALSDIKDGPERRLTALRNLVTFGKAISHVLQNLRSCEPDFDLWWQPVADGLRNDPLAKFFYELRNRILKEGELGVGSSTHIEYLNSSDLARLPKPPGVTSMFIGDSAGGMGWTVEVSPGVIEKYYANFPVAVKTSLFFVDAPGATAGTPSESSDAVVMCEKYVATLEKIVKEAEIRFAPGVKQANVSR